MTIWAAIIPVFFVKDAIAGRMLTFLFIGRHSVFPLVCTLQFDEHFARSGMTACNKTCQPGLAAGSSFSDRLLYSYVLLRQLEHPNSSAAVRWVPNLRNQWRPG